MKAPDGFPGANDMSRSKSVVWLVAAISLLLSGAASADRHEPSYRQDDQLLLSALNDRRMNLEVGKQYALGLSKHRLDHETEVLGWQVSDTVYFGRQRGEDSGLTLVWQQRNNQVSLSKDGLRLTRRF